MVATKYKITNSAMFPLETHYKGQHQKDAALSKMEQDLEIIINQFVSDSQNLETFMSHKLDTLFDFRISSLNWLITHRIGMDDWKWVLEEVLADFKEDPKFSVLYQNILFAVRTNIRVMNSLAPTVGIQSEIDFFDLKPIPKQSFKDFLNMMSFTAPHFNLEQYRTWMIASLQIEFGVIATFLIHEKKIAINDLKINELAYLVANAAQTFGAISREIRNISNKAKPQPSVTFSSAFLAEQQFIAEQDLVNYRKII